MLQYIPGCDIILHVSTLAELTEAVNRLLVA
jgi:hypothetical protein